MIRGRYIAAVLAVAANCISFAAYGQNRTGDHEYTVPGSPAVFSFALNLGGAPAPEPIATPPAAPAASAADHGYMVPAVSTTATGLSADTPWFQRFLLPVPEASGAVDDWLSCSRPGVMGNLDYLNWSARRSGMDFASFSSSVTNATALPAPTQSLDFNQAGGFRGGIGYRFGNGWNVGWTYTYFRIANAETATASSTPNSELIATQSYLSTSQTFKVPMDSIEADGTLQMNIQDFQAEWTSCLNDSVGFTAFGGFRWAKIDQNFNNNYSYGGGTGSVNLPNNMDGEGIRLGAEIQWRSSCGLRVFARGAESVLVADFQTRQHEVDPAAGITIDVSNDTAAVVPVFEGTVGVAYARGPWEFRAAFEMSDWFNLVQVNRPAQSLLLDGYFLSLSFSR
jgi:hypothetical protein